MLTRSDEEFGLRDSAGLDKAFAERCVEVGIQEHMPAAIISQSSPMVYTEKLKNAGILKKGRP